MASITVDIQAKVVGYEASLKAMKDAFSKIDPGSDIGKSLEKAIKYAEGQLKNLNKNLTPKASSDTQIDSIIEKTNRAGEAIQEVSTLMQKVNFGDIDFSSFENGIGKLMSTLQDLETELESRVSKGLREAVTNSTELTESFSKLNIDVKDKSAGEIFEAVSEKALKAAEDTEKARVALENAQKNLNSQQGRLDQLESNPIYNKDNLQKDLQGITEEYTKTFDNIKIQIQNGLKNLLGSDNVQADKLMENFTAGLNPQTLKEHLMQLKNALQHELKDNNSAKEIYTALLGGDGASGNAQAITTRLLSNLNNALPNIKQEFQNKIQEFVSSLTNKEAGQITTLISTGDIDGALKATIQAIERAYSSVKGSVIKQRAEVKKAMEGQETAQTNFDSAEQSQQAIETVRTQLQEQINTLTNENSQLRDEIKQIKASIEEKKNAEVNKIRDTASDSSRKTDSLRVSAEEAQMYRTELEQVQAKEKLIGKIEGVVQRWFSIYAAVRMVGNAIRSVISTVQELDKTITEIAIVTNMTQDELWGQMKSYTDMARQYAASISGVYQVSQLYYQQGLQTADVMALTEETLKMARISGLGYAEATDYMTNAVRSFKMEMTDAQRVVDVYSEIAASSATSTSELASAMSKTASSAEAVGSSFENTTAMMAVMIEATRESAENIGSAMKSIISRYGEMTTDPSKLTDSEGQEMSLNKVDKALKSVGISIQDTNHQFRDFDDVITELAGKWDTIDTNTQRYIATVMAGNRQQSRFLALVSNGERLAELSEAAANSQDAATLQVLKTMDSIEAKTQQLKTSLQSLYVDAGIEKLYKGLLDFGATIIKTFTNFAQEMGTPLAAVAKFGLQFASLANIVTTVFGLIKAKTQAQIAALNGQERNAAAERMTIAQQEVAQKEILMIQEQIAKEKSTEYETEDERAKSQERIRIWEEELAAKQGIANAPIGAPGSKNTKGVSKNMARIGMVANLAGSALSLGAASIGEKTQTDRTTKAWMTGAGSTLQGVGMGVSFGPWGMAIGGALGAITGALEAIGIATESTTEKIENLGSAIEETGNKKLQSKDELKTLLDYKKRYEELVKIRNQDAESREEWIKLNNEIAAAYPELIKNMDMEGNYIVDMTIAYQQLAEAKLGVYKNDFLSNMSAELQGLNDIDYVLSKIYNVNPIENNWNLIGKAFSTSQSIGQDSTNQFINYLLGLSEEKPSMTVDTIEHLFGGKASGLVSSSYLPGFGGVPGKYFESINEKYEGASELLLQQFYDLSQSGLSLEEAKLELEQQYNDSTLLAAIANFNSDVYNYLLSAGKAIEFQDTLIKNKTEKGNQEWLNIISQMHDLEPSSIQNVLALNELNEKWNTYLTENATRLNTEEVNEDGVGTHTVDAGVLYQEFINQYQGQWLNQFINDNKQFSDEALNELYDQAGKYNRSTYISKLKSMNIADEDLDKLMVLYDKAYTEAIEYFRESVASRFEKGTFEYAKAIELSKIIPPDFFEAANEKIQQIYSNDLLTDDIKTIQFNAFSKIVRSIDQLPELQQAKAYGALERADLTSLTGVYNFLDDLANAGVELDGSLLENAIKNFSDNLIINLTTEFDSFAQSIISQTEDFDKALNNVSKGMDLKTASEMADKLSLSLDKDFDFRDGKFFLKDATQIADGYLKFNENLKNALDEEKAQVVSATENFDLANIFKKATDLLSNDWVDSIEDGINFALGENAASADTQLLLQIYQKYYQQAIDAGKDINTYIAEQLADSESKLEVIKQATDYATNVALIEAGQIELFLSRLNDAKETPLSNEEFTAIINAITSGDLQSITDQDVLTYISTLYKYYQNAEKTLYKSALDSITNGPQLIEVTNQNQAFLKKYATKTNGEKFSQYEWPKLGSQVWLDFTKEDIDILQAQIQQSLAEGAITKNDAQSLLASIHAEKYKDNLYNSLEQVIKSYDSVGYETIQSLANALNKTIDDLLGGQEGSIFKDIAPVSINDDGTFKVNLERLDTFLMLQYDKLSNDSYNKIRAQLEQAKFAQDKFSIINKIVTNRNKITQEDIGNFATALGERYEIIEDLLQPNADGTYTLNLATIQQLINEGKIEINEELNQLIANEIDNIISSLTGLGTLQNKGTTNIEDMQKHVAAINQQLGQSFSMQDLFVYDEQLNAFVYSIKGLQNQAASLAIQLESLKLNTEENADEIWAVEQSMKTIAVQMANNIDFSSVLDLAIGDPARDIKFDELRQAIEDYNTVLAEIGIAIGLNTDELIYSLRYGGEKAVIAAEAIAKAQGKTLSADDVEAAYRTQIANFTNAINDVISGPGEIVDTVTADLIQQNGGIVNELGNTGQYIVQKTANLYDAYNDLYNRMARTGEATLADLNRVAALALDYKGGEQIAIDSLSKATNLTYSELGEIFTNSGKVMTKELVQEWTDKKIVKAVGGSNIQITDFKAVAEALELNTDSEEFTSAFKSYNDSLIDMNRQAERNILEEAQNVTSAKVGDWINLTQLSDALEKQIASVTQQGNNAPVIKTGLDGLNEALQKYGAQIEDGILKLGPNANIPAIMQEIAQAAAESGGLLANEMAELADAVADAIKGYADLISGGVEGSLSNVQAEELQSWADQLGIGKLDFTPTADGLKIATNQAIQLSQELSKIDGIQGQLVFEDLIEALSADKGNNFENISRTMGEIADKQKEIRIIQENINILREQQWTGEKLTKEEQLRLNSLQKQKAVLQEQLDLYGKIAAQQMDNPDSYNFMNRDLPNVFQGPINYWNSVGQAFGAMRSAGQSGKMDIQDFYNVVNEMSNLAAATGSEIEFMGKTIDGKLETAADLIESGFNSLSNVDGKGVQIDMAKLAKNLDTGATKMGEGFDDAVRKMAESQVHMLDAMIQVLETIVAMEKLGKIDIDKNGLLSVSEIFDGENFTPLFDGVREYLLNSEALKPLLDDLKVNGVTLKELLDSDQTAWKDAGISMQQYADIMSAFYQASLSDNYDLDSLISSVQNVLAGTGQVFSYYNKETGIETVIEASGRSYTVNWDDEEERKRIRAAFEEAGYSKEKLDTLTTEEYQKILNQGQAGKLTGEALIAYELTYGIITKVTDEDGNDTYVDDYGNISNNLTDAIIKNALSKQQAQANAVSGVIDSKMGEKEAKRQSFQTSNGLSYDLTVDVEGREIYSTTASDGSLVTAETYSEMINALLNKESLIETGGHLSIDQRSEEDILRLKRKLGVVVTPDIIFKDSSNKEFNPENDPNIKTQLGQFLNKSHESIAQSLEHTDSGTYIATLFDGSKIEVKAENTDEVIAKLQTALDPVITSISTAITNAFTVNNEENGNAIQSAITTAIQNAFTKLNELPEQEISEVSAKITNLQITGVDKTDFGGLNALGSKFGIGSNLTIPDATAKIGNLKLTGADLVDTSSFKTLGEQIAQAIQEGLTNAPVSPNVQTSPTTSSPDNLGDNSNNGQITPSAVNIETVSVPDATIDLQSPTITATTPMISAENSVINGTFNIAGKVGGGESENKGTENAVGIDISAFETAISGIENAVSVANSTLTNLASSISGLPDKSKEVTNTANAIKALQSKNVTFTGTVKGTVEGTIKAHISADGAATADASMDKVEVTSASGTRAKGNVALAKGKGTLMGELGPELVVSNGRYFVAGANGAEMVNLADDAIVFNHLQTEKLLRNGKINNHGKPITNERKAVSFATGNANGPAMASASEALAALKQLRAMWESLRNASLKDMGGMPGGSGGGGGGGGNDETKQAVAGVTAEVERWYNWLTKIETTEEHINKLTKEHTLLEKQRISTNQKLNNLQQQYNDLANNRDTRIQLAREQTSYRNQLLNQVGFDANGNPRSALSAFYRAGANGELLLAQDKAFSDFVAKRGDFSAENKARIAAGKSVAMTVTQQRGITAEEAKKLNAANKKSGKTDYKAGDIVEEALTKKQAKALGLKVGTKLGETITNITLPTSGLALMEELQKRDEFGNLVYTAKSQYDMLQKLGFGSFMTQDSQGNQIDTSTDEGIATAVQNFYDRVDGAKEEIESLTSSINEQEQAALDDAIAMQEINEQIIELYKPISGVTEELEEWYNYLRRINDLQAENNLLVKENELLQSNQTAEGDKIYNNLKQRTELLMQQRLEQEALLKAQQQQTRELQNQVLNDKRLRDFFSSNGEGNSLLFNEGVMGQNFQYLSDQQLKKNNLGYYVDEKGQYIDQTGVLRNANNEVVTNGQFGQVQLDENSVQVKTFNSKGKTLTEIVEELNKQNLDGSFVYGASEAYQILKTMGLGDFMRFDENGNELYANFGELTREEQQNAINTGIKRLQETINNINENVDTQKQTELDILDTDKELIDIKNTLRENAISVENNFKEAIVQERQNAIDTKNELKDALNNAIDKTINGLKDSLEAERKTYDSDKDEKELTALQSQLALLRSSNGSLGKIRDLQNKIRDKQQQMYFAERENAIDELEKSAENQIEALETQIDIMQTALDYQVENGLIWAEINAKLSEWSPEQIASYISQINKDYAKGPTEQEKVMNETLENAQLYKQQQTIPLPTTANRNVTTPQVINKNVTTPQLPPKVTTPTPTVSTTSPAKTVTVATSQVQQEEKREEKQVFSNIIPVIKDGLKYYTKNKANYKTKAAGILNAGDSFVVEGLSNKKTYTTKKDGTRYMMKAKVGSKSVYVPLWYTYLPENLYDNLISAGLPRFKKGGAVDFTGPAWVDGSKTKPEQIFNFDQMEQLREIFYENLAMTQVGISGLSSIIDNLPNTNSYNSINNEDYGVNIGQLDFHMEVQEIANGYDARRAGREAMEEMVRIARKTGNRSVSRR